MVIEIVVDTIVIVTVAIIGDILGLRGNARAFFYVDATMPIMQKTLPIDTFDQLDTLVTEVLPIITGVSDRTGAFVVALNGDLGSGKTTFTQQLGARLGVSEPMTSPTFVIMKQYAIDTALYQTFVHMDAYRIEDVDELRVLGFAALLQQKETMICIEWAEQVAAALPEDGVLRIDFSLTGSTRTATITYGSPNE